MTRLLCVALLFTLSACSTLDTVETFDAAAQPGADDAYDFAKDRLCALPLDIQVRAIERHGEDYLDGLTGICPDWRKIQLYFVNEN